jgi:hypothetical protein
MGVRRVGAQTMSNAATMSISAAVAQWTPKATAFGPPLRNTIVPSAMGISAGQHQGAEQSGRSVDEEDRDDDRHGDVSGGLDREPGRCLSGLANLAGDAESGGGWSGIEKVPGANQGDSDGDHS